MKGVNFVVKKGIGIIILILCLIMSLNAAAYPAIKYSTKKANENIEFPVKKVVDMIGGNLIFEAENADFDKRYMSVKKDETASGGQYLHVNQGLPDVKNEYVMPEAQFTVDFNSKLSSTSTMWIRIYASNDSSDSGWFSLNDGGYAYINTPYFKEWLWISTPCEVYEGVNTINFKYREQNYKIDKIIITADKTFVPKGANDVPSGSSVGNTDSIYPIPEIKPIAEHPRLYITSKDIAKLNEKKTNPVFTVAWEKLSAQANSKVSGVLKEVGNAETNYNETVLNVVQAKALMYVMDKENNLQYGKDAVQIIKDFMDTVKYDLSYVHLTRILGYTITVGSIVYDWCYDLISPQEKLLMIEKFRGFAASKEIGWPPVKQSSFSDHACEEEIFRDLLAVGIAVYDEDQEFYNLAAGRYFAEMVPLRRDLLFKSRGINAPGDSYGLMRAGWEGLSNITFNRMGYGSVLGEDASQQPYWSIYARRPDGQWFADGNSYNMSTANYFQYRTTDYQQMLMTAGQFKDPYIQGLVYKELSLGGYANSSFYTFLFLEEDVETKSLDTLPLARYFGWPHSTITARTSWQNGVNAPTAMVNFNMKNIYNSNHTHYDVGNFQIYYKGALAIDSGDYNGALYGYGGYSNVNYSFRSVAHNVVLVHDPDEKFVRWGMDTVNDGGQFWRKETEMTMEEAMSEDNLVSETISHSIGPDEYVPDYAYVKGNISKAYSEKVKDYTRSLVYLDMFDDEYPMAVLCFDRVVSSNPEFKKSWLLHSIEEPEIDGNLTTIKRTEYGFNGKLVNKTILPEEKNLQIEKIGGKGKEAWVEDKNYFNPPNTTYNGQEHGSWRIEVSPKNAKNEDLFLNAMYVTDADNEKPALDIEKVNTSQFVGAKLRDRVVMFAKRDKLVSSSFSYKINNQDGALNYNLVCDLSEGTWQITTDRGETIYAKVNEGENTLYFSSVGSSFTITPVSDGDYEYQTFRKVTKKGIGDFEVWYANKNLFLNQESEVKIIDNRAYLPASMLRDLGYTVSGNDKKIKITTGGSVIEITADSNTILISGKERNVINTPKSLNGEVYVAVGELSLDLLMNFEYDAIAKILHVSKTPDWTQLSKISPRTPLSKEPIRLVASGAQTGNEATGICDGNDKTRWSSQGVKEWVMYDLGAVYDISNVKIAAYLGDERVLYFDIQVSEDGGNFKTVYSGETSGTTSDFESFAISPSKARYVKLCGKGTNESTWNSITEFVVE